MITRLLPLTNYISGTENETQRALLGHTNGNIEMRSPSAAAMLTMVAAATIVRFPPVLRLYSNISKLLLLYKAWGVLWEIKLYKILGDILLICQNTVYSRYIAVVYIAELDILRSRVGPHFLGPKSVIFFEIVVTPWTQFAGDNRKQFFAKSTAVRWAAMLDRALTPPLCRRVMSN